MAYTYYKFRCIVCKNFVTEREYFDIEGYSERVFESCDAGEGVKHCGKLAKPIPFKANGPHPDSHQETYNCGPFLGHAGGR